MKVSVCMITYNHGKYIKQALDSVISQKINFEIEVIIGDDGSKDDTRGILEEYQQKYPGIVKPILRPVNVGAFNNFIDALEQCTGEYIALLEGDDYWSCNDKLAQQVLLLESRKDINLSFHNYSVRSGNKIRARVADDIPGEFDIHHLLRNTNFIKTLTVTFRNDRFVIEFLKAFTKAPVGDYLLFIGSALHGRVHYTNKPWGVYRVHTGGNWSQDNLTALLDKYIFVIQSLYDHPALLNYRDDLRIQLADLFKWEATTCKGEAAVSLEKYQQKLKEMEVPAFMADYIIKSAAETRSAGWLAKMVPIATLLKAASVKLKGRIRRR